jgi:hypothetical protein
MALFRLGPERAEEHTSFSAASLRCARIPRMHWPLRGRLARKADSEGASDDRLVNTTLNKHATVDASNEVRVTTHSSPPKEVVNDT